jgi:hypothetical protein
MRDRFRRRDERSPQLSSAIASIDELNAAVSAEDLLYNGRARAQMTA